MRKQFTVQNRANPFALLLVCLMNLIHSDFQRSNTFIRASLGFHRERSHLQPLQIQTQQLQHVGWTVLAVKNRYTTGSSVFPYFDVDLGAVWSGTRTPCFLRSLKAFGALRRTRSWPPAAFTEQPQRRSTARCPGCLLGPRTFHGHGCVFRGCRR